MKKRLCLLCFALVFCLSITGCQSEEKKTDVAELEEAAVSEKMKTAIAEFEAIAVIVEQKNNELNSAIQAAEELLSKDTQALDVSLIPLLETTVSECKAARYIIPEIPQEIAEVIAITEDLIAVDYTSTLTKLSENQARLEDSIRRYSLVNAPSEAYVIKCLHAVPNIIDIAAATEANDPNGQLNKQGAYTANVYFSSDLIDQNIFDADSVIEKGTDCGGSIEVYSNVSDALRRNEYLASFDGGVLASGSHVVVGTVLVRTSNELTASKQKALEANIIAALTDNADAISEPLKPAEQTKDTEDPVSPKQDDPQPSPPSPMPSRNSLALARAEEFIAIDYAGPDWVSREWLYSCLTGNREFTDEEADYAIANVDVDWFAEAVAHANGYQDEMWIFPTALAEDLMSTRWFTEEESQYAIKNCAIDWNQQACVFLGEISEKNITRDQIVAALAEYGFSAEQGNYAVDNGNIDWAEKIDDYLAETALVDENAREFMWCENCCHEVAFGRSTCPICKSFLGQYSKFGWTREETIVKLIEAGFPDTAVKEVVSQYRDQYFLDES